MFLRGKTLNNIFMLSFMVGIGLLLSNSIALPLQQHHANLDSNSFNSNANLENSTNYQTSYDTSLLSSGTNAGWASSKPFSVSGEYGSRVNVVYKENGFIMGSGANDFGQLGNTTTTHVGEPFALYKEGNQQTPFYNAIDYTFSLSSGVIDSTGKLYTAGYGYEGGLGNGYSHSSLTDQDGNPGVVGYLGDYGYGSNQYSFQQVITAKDVLDANKANALPDDYQAVALDLSYRTGLLLLNDGTLYGAGHQYQIGLGTSTTAQTHYTRLDGRATGLPAATSANKIKDIGAGGSSSWVLYENGELYMTSHSSALGATVGAYTLVASDIKFFDIEGSENSTNTRVYAVNTSNQILSCTERATTLETLVASPNGTVTQVRGTYSGGWGYLNSNNELYLSVTEAVYNAGTAPTASNSTPTGTTFYKMDNVAFFDLGGSSSSMTYGVMYTNGAMTVWGDNTSGQLGNGEVGTGGNVTTPEAGVKPDIEVAPEDIPNVEEDTLKDPEDVVFSHSPILYSPPATPPQLLNIFIYKNRNFNEKVPINY